MRRCPKRLRPGWTGSLLLLAITGATGALAHAGVDPVALAWNAPAGSDCPTRDEVVAEVHRLLEGGRGGRVPVTARVDIEGDRERQWRARLQLESPGGRGERAFEAGSCGAIASAAAVIIAVGAEGGPLPTATSAPAGASPAPTSTAPPAAVSRAAPPPPVPAAPPSGTTATRSGRLWLAMSGLVASGTMPGGLVGGGEADLGWQLVAASWRFRASVGAGAFPARTSPATANGEAGRFSLLVGQGRLCAARVVGRWDIGPCAGGQLARMTGTGQGPATTIEPASTTATWGALLAGGALSCALARDVAAVALGEIVVAPGAQSFVVQPGSTLVYRPSRVAGQVGLGLALHFM